ncbi:hypothetical protein SAMN05216244_3380 [Sediminibacillus halophilus]|uniref:Uncharacterized protein n=1 Tax=Sediminibacillus halophilus TaxID=482461 RepID=A0A1G9W1Q2_9BACI|nr:hypothetical protein SAMN05216244_3380 [Sediminibacillus halophilus]
MLSSGDSEEYKCVEMASFKQHTFPNHKIKMPSMDNIFHSIRTKQKTQTG